jgi:hypothetical protein
MTAIARTFIGTGWSLEQYDEVIERMNLGGKSAPGVLFHWAAATPDGVQVVDVYDSRESADRLAGEKIGPIVAELGLPMPAIAEHELHAVLSP